MADDARLSTALSSHPKTRKLKKRLGAEGCWSLVCLLLWVAGNRSDGNLGGMSDEDIELAAEWEGDAGTFVRTAAQVRFLDGETGNYKIHDWWEHNPFAATRGIRVEAARKAAAARWEKGGKRIPVACDSDAERMRNDENRNAHHTTPPHPTQPHETGNQNPYRGPHGDNRPTEADLERLYALYPRKRDPLSAKKSIRKAIHIVMRGDADHPAMPVEDALNYLADRVTLYGKFVQGDYVKYPSTWFNAGAFWDDERDWQKEAGRENGNANKAQRVQDAAVQAVYEAKAALRADRVAS